MATLPNKLLRSSVSGKVPTPEQLEYGQLAVNFAAGEEKLFLKNSEDEVVSIGGDIGPLDEGEYVVPGLVQGAISAWLPANDDTIPTTIQFKILSDSGNIMVEFQMLLAGETSQPMTVPMEQLIQRGAGGDGIPRFVRKVQTAPVTTLDQIIALQFNTNILTGTGSFTIQPVGQLSSITTTDMIEVVLDHNNIEQFNLPIVPISSFTAAGPTVMLSSSLEFDVVYEYEFIGAATL